MTTEINVGDGPACRRCSFPNQAGDQFCQHCGEAVFPQQVMSQPTLTTGWPAHNGGPVRAVPPAQQDATTRYLCAAAHLDPAFGDRAIAEFLVEPVRAIPPSPGVDSAAVLRDAVAARTRRRIRDAVLLLLLVVLGYVSLSALLAWLVVALVVSACVCAIAWSAAHSSRPVMALAKSLGGAAVGRWRNTVIFALLALAGIGLLSQLLSLGMLGTPQIGQYDALPAAPAVPYGALVIGGLALMVIGIDRVIVHNLVYHSFRRSSFAPDGRRAGSSWERAVRTLGHASFRYPLARVEAADEQGADHQDLADVIVYRGFSPFVGAGERIHRKIIPLPLEPVEESEASAGNARPTPRPISVVELHEHVAAAINELRSSSSLGPGGRLGGLTRREQVLVAADQLVTHLDTQPQPGILADLHRPPAAQIPIAAARRVADTPHEWARYYQCFRIEAWDRDLTTSCYLHAGTDQRMLYLEWAFCALPPIEEDYREIDRLRDPVLTSVKHVLLELVVLPVSVIRRWRSVFHRFKPLIQRAGEVVPDKYGAGESLRELAAADDVQTYFQDADVERYVRILDKALFRAVGRYLEDHGYSVVEFMKSADPTVNQFNVAGNFFGSAVMGSGNNVQGNNVQGNNLNQSTSPKGTP